MSQNIHGAVTAAALALAFTSARSKGRWEEGGAWRPGAHFRPRVPPANGSLSPPLPHWRKTSPQSVFRRELRLLIMVSWAMGGMRVPVIGDSFYRLLSRAASKCRSGPEKGSSEPRSGPRDSYLSPKWFPQSSHRSLSVPHPVLCFSGSQSSPCPTFWRLKRL